MLSYFSKENSLLQEDVTNELKWDPSINATEINVTAEDGIITLRGNVPHFQEKLRAEVAAQRVGGVRAIADELEVNILGQHERSDEELAKAAVMALEWNYQVPDTVKVTVSKGWVTLRGNVSWDYQRNAAGDAVGMLFGVVGVSNDIVIKSAAKAHDVKSRIEEALIRSAENEGRGIKVSISESKVTLSGHVRSFEDMHIANLAARSAPGVTNVESTLILSL